MKKTVISAIVTLALIATMTGCSKGLATKDSKQISKTGSSTQSTSSKTSASNQEKAAVKDIKNLDDSKLVEQISGGEEELKIDGVDSSSEDLDVIDDILNEKDPIADIPSNVKVDK